MEARRQDPCEPLIQYYWSKMKLVDKCEGTISDTERMEMIMKGIHDPKIIRDLYLDSSLTDMDKFYSKLRLLSGSNDFVQLATASNESSY